jgi:hypothetical protein
MTDSYIQTPPDSTGKKLDTSQIVVGANTVQRERVVLADNTTAANFAAINVSGQLSVIGPITDAELRATALPVSGPLTDMQLRATAVPISGAVTANTGLSQPLTDTQLRATAVPISVAALPLPSGAATSDNQTNGLQKTKLTDEYGSEIEGTMLNQLKVADSYRLAGGVFNDALIDTNFYATAVAANATVTNANAVAALTTTTDSGSSAELTTVATARYIGANSNYFRAVARISVTGATNNVMRLGATTGNGPTDGCYFKYDGTTLSVVTKLNGTETVVSSGSFNGSGSGSNETYVLDTNYHVFEIHYTNRRVRFTIDDAPIHIASATTEIFAATRHLKPYLSNINTGVGSAVVLYAASMTISRLGTFHTQPKIVHIAGANAGTLYKTGPGTLHRIVLNASTSTTVVSIYDATSATNAIAIINAAASSPIVSLEYMLEFTVGLYIVTAGATTDITVIYE